MKNFSIEGKNAVFKTLPLSRLVYLALLAVTPNHITDEVAKIKKYFLWDDSSPKVKHETLRID